MAVGGLGNAPKISPVSGLEWELAAHKFPACYTTGQHSLSVDRCVCFLPFLQRSISDLSQLEYPQGLNNPPLGMYRKGFFCHLCVCSFLTAFSARSAAVFSNFAVANRQMRWHVVLRHSHIDGISPKKTPSFCHSMPSKAFKNASVCSAFSCDCWDGSETG